MGLHLYRSPRPALAIVIVAALAAVAVAGTELTGSEVTSNRVADPGEVYDPYAAGEALPAGYLPVYRRDFIQPIYDPRFVSAEATDWPDDTDVIGVEIDGDARAYPVGLLTGREMVIDEVADVPLLVSW